MTINIGKVLDVVTFGVLTTALAWGFASGLRILARALGLTR